MSLSGVDKILVTLAVADIAGIIIWISICLHLAYTQLDVILEHLENSPAVTARAPLRHGGPWGKLLLIGGISGIVTFPGFYLKRGQLSAEDLENLPTALKRKLVILYKCVLGLLSVMVVFGIGIELGFY